MLKQRAVSATIWTTADLLTRQGLQFAVSIALARYVAPEAFGTIALLYLFTGIASTFIDCGFSSALVQRADVTHTDESTVFWFNAGMGVLAAAVLGALSPLVARMFGIAVLSPLLWAMAGNLLITALGAIHATLLTKRLEFRTQMKVGTIASLASAAVAVPLAMQGYGVWALAAQILTSTTMTTMLLWWWSDWRPAWVFEPRSARSLLAFGGNLMASNLLEIIYSRAYTLLIGKYFGVRELAFYNRADTTKQLPVGILMSVFSRVAFPVFAQSAHESGQLRRGVRLALRGTTLANTPLVLGLCALGDQVVEALFGDTWLPSVPAMRILCVGAVFWPLHVINLNVLMARGLSNIYLRLELLKKVLGIALLLAGMPFGVLGIATSQAVFSALGVGLNASFAQREIQYGTLAQLRDFAPVLGLGALMALLVFFLGQRLQLPAAQELVILVPVGGALFVGGGLLLRLVAFQEALSVCSAAWKRRTASGKQAG